MTLITNGHKQVSFSYTETWQVHKNLPHQKSTLGNFSDTLHNFKKVGKNVAGSRTFEKKNFTSPGTWQVMLEKMQVSKTWQVSELYEMKYVRPRKVIQWGRETEGPSSHIIDVNFHLLLSVCTFTENSVRQLNCPFLPALNGLWPCKVIQPEGYRGQGSFWFTLTWPLAYRVPPWKTAVAN